jgi:hypothetical protein
VVVQAILAAKDDTGEEFEEEGMEVSHDEEANDTYNDTYKLGAFVTTETVGEIVGNWLVENYKESTAN